MRQSAGQAQQQGAAERSRRQRPGHGQQVSRRSTGHPHDSCQVPFCKSGEARTFRASPTRNFSLTYLHPGLSSHTCGLQPRW